MILHAGPVAKIVLLVLFLFSVVSWAIILQKSFRFRVLARESARFWRRYEESDLRSAAERCLAPNGKGLPLRTLFRAGLREAFGGDGRGGVPIDRVRGGSLPRERVERIERAMERASLLEMEQLERHLPFLATTANVSPFFGLFGTVWGVMSSFLAMGVKGSASLAVVGPGIAEALITTVAGLAAAIPAVIAYNHFLGRLRSLSIDLDRFRSSLTDRLTEGGDDAVA
ncbi:MAG: MotA/TolQ/ExbB proton channel family protein [Candidatus Eisenbacteria bacterium]|nr:MotA/TolQ/ExbB proton channel family protein [Candidatus Eisenbacteria bacterium]